jgi:hypothetical protein
MYGGMQIGAAYFGIGNTTDNTGATTNRTFMVANSFASGVNGSTRVLTTIPFTTGKTYLLVAKLAFSGTGIPGSDTYSLWINPLTSDEIGAGIPQAVNNRTTSTSLSSVSFYASSTGFGMTVDEFRLGTTWASVTPGLPILSPNLSIASGDGLILSASNCVPGLNYIFQSTTNLANSGFWRMMATNMPGTNGFIQFTDSSAPTPTVFYRTVVPEIWP